METLFLLASMFCFNFDAVKFNLGFEIPKLYLLSMVPVNAGTLTTTMLN